MSTLLEQFDKLHSFYQQLIVAAIFASLLWIGGKLLSFVFSLSKDWQRSQDVDRLQKHWLHKYYVNTGGMYFFTQGYLFILKKASERVLAAFLLLIFYFGITSLINGSWLGFVFAYLAFSSLWEARSWLQDQSSDAAIAGIDPTFAKEVLDRFGDPHKKSEMQDGLMETQPPAPATEVKRSSLKKK